MYIIINQVDNYIDDSNIFNKNTRLCTIIKYQAGKNRSNLIYINFTVIGEIVCSIRQYTDFNFKWKIKKTNLLALRLVDEKPIRFM